MPGSSIRMDCECKQGFFSAHVGEECLKCPDQLQCDWRTSLGGREKAVRVNTTRSFSNTTDWNRTLAFIKVKADEVEWKVRWTGDWNKTLAFIKVKADDVEWKVRWTGEYLNLVNMPLDDGTSCHTTCLFFC